MLERTVSISGEGHAIVIKETCRPRVSCPQHDIFFLTFFKWQQRTNSYLAGFWRQNNLTIPEIYQPVAK